MSSKLFSCLLVMGLAALLGCAGSTTPEVDGASDVTAEAQLHSVRCGCSIESIGKCGNYVDIDGKPLLLGGDIGLGKMEFCGQGTLTASLEGAVKDGVFVATAFELRP